MNPDRLETVAVIGLGVFMLLSVSGVLIWFFTRTSKSVEMMYYVPEDAQFAMGMNIGQRFGGRPPMFCG